MAQMVSLVMPILNAQLPTPVWLHVTPDDSSLAQAKRLLFWLPWLRGCGALGIYIYKMNKMAKNLRRLTDTLNFHRQRITLEIKKIGCNKSHAKPKPCLTLPFNLRFIVHACGISGACCPEQSRHRCKNTRLCRTAGPCKTAD